MARIRKGLVSVRGQQRDMKSPDRLHWELQDWDRYATPCVSDGVDISSRKDARLIMKLHYQKDSN